MERIGSIEVLTTLEERVGDRDLRAAHRDLA
jgi:hypothetical protein